MKNDKTDLTVVIPAYREEKRIGGTLDELASYIRKDKLLRDLKIEVLVVSADSSDKTHEIVQSKAKLFKDLKLLKPGPKVGKGRDVQFGMLRAKGEAILFMDADLATPLKYLSKFYALYADGCDVVVATRNLRKHHPGFSRRALSNLGNLLYRLLGGVWIEDSQCGFKLFSKNASKVCFSKMTIMGWGFDMEILTIAKINNFRIKAVRVNDWKSVPGGQFADSAIKSAVYSFSELMLIFKNRVTGRYRA